MTSLLYEDDRVVLRRVVVGALKNNVFIVQCRSSGRSALVDAADDAPALLNLCREFHIERVITTHGHHDHVGAAPALQKAGYPVGLHPADSVFFATYDEPLTDGQSVVVGNISLRVIATPGHTFGSVCFAVDDTPILLTGDTLFPGGPGATGRPHSDFTTIMQSLTDIIFVQFGDKTIVWPGHGASTTIGAERPHLDEWRRRGW